MIQAVVRKAAAASWPAASKACFAIQSIDAEFKRLENDGVGVDAFAAVGEGSVRNSQANFVSSRESCGGIQLSRSAGTGQAGI